MREDKWNRDVGALIRATLLLLPLTHPTGYVHRRLAVPLCGSRHLSEIPPRRLFASRSSRSMASFGARSRRTTPPRCISFSAAWMHSSSSALHAPLVAGPIHGRRRPLLPITSSRAIRSTCSASISLSRSTPRGLFQFADITFGNRLQPAGKLAQLQPAAGAPVRHHVGSARRGPAGAAILRRASSATRRSWWCRSSPRFPRSSDRCARPNGAPL